MTEPFLSQNWYRVADLRPRLAGHVRVHRHRYRGRPWYVTQDDLSGRQHRFTPQTYLFVGLMDGRRSVDEIWNLVVDQIGDDAPTQGETLRLLSQMHAADLLQGDVPPSARDLFRRQESHAARSRRQRFANPLSIRIRLLDPDRFLDRTKGLVAPLLSPAGALMWLAVVAPAIVLAALHWPELTDNATDRIMTGENLALVALIYPILKILHELGHAYATKCQDGEVHDFGLLFMAFVPVPYVDASASTAFRSKWRRAFVGAAGMVVETFVAALALYVWVLSEPGTVRAVAFNVMLIAGVSTILFNANPLVRFDGYFILCDIAELPNLGQRASRFWTWLAERFLFRLEPQPARDSASERACFVAYAPLALAYRLVLSLGIAAFVAQTFFFAGIVLAIWGVAATIAWPLLKMVAYLIASPRLQGRRGRALLASASIAGAVAAALVWLPFPLHTGAEGVVWLPDDSFVRAGADGFVTTVDAVPGRWVEMGTPLIHSDDPSIDAGIAVLRSQIEALRHRLASEDFTDRAQSDLTRQEIQVKASKLAREEQRAGTLVVRSPSSGIFVLPRPQDLPGRYVKRGDVIGYVTPVADRVVRVVVAQADIELVRDRLLGVAVKIADRAGETAEAAVLREVPGASDQLPSKALADAGGGRLAADPRDKNQTKTLNRTFQFDLALPSLGRPDHYGTRVFVRFDHGTEPLGRQWYRRGRQLFLARFDA